MLHKLSMENATIQGEHLMEGLRELQKNYERMGDVRDVASE